MKLFVNKIIKILVPLIFWPFKYIVPKGNIIILQTYSPYIYCENTRYLYEYLSNHTDYEVYWITESEEIKQYLDLHKLKYITKRKILNYLYITVRARVVISPGSSFHNPFKLTSKKAIKISTFHGTGPKVTARTFDNLKDSLKEIYRINKFDYVNFPSKYSAARTGKGVYRIPKSTLINLGYPRCDMFFRKEYVKEKYSKKEITKYLLGVDFISNAKIVFYTPTWRPYKYYFPLLKLEDLNIEVLNEFLGKENIFFFYTVHAGNPPCNLPLNLSRIRYIDHIKYPLFDTNLFMIETDILLNDYSTSSVDFAIFNKPQLFFMPDYECYNLEKGFIEDYKAILPGKEICSFDEFKNTMIACLSDQESYLKQHENKRKLLLERYYDVSIENSCEIFTQFIHSLMKKIAF